MDIKIVDLIGLLRFFSERGDRRREERSNAIVATNKALRETRAYLEELRMRPGSQSSGKERKLGEAWESAGALMMAFDRDQANAMFLKARYWSSRSYFEMSGDESAVPTLRELENQLRALM